MHLLKLPSFLADNGLMVSFLQKNEKTEKIWFTLINQYDISRGVVDEVFPYFENKSIILIYIN